MHLRRRSGRIGTAKPLAERIETNLSRRFVLMELAGRLSNSDFLARVESLLAMIQEDRAQRGRGGEHEKG